MAIGLLYNLLFCVHMYIIAASSWPHNSLSCLDLWTSDKYRINLMGMKPRGPYMFEMNDEIQ